MPAGGHAPPRLRASRARRRRQRPGCRRIQQRRPRIPTACESGRPLHRQQLDGHLRCAGRSGRPRLLHRGVRTPLGGQVGVRERSRRRGGGACGRHAREPRPQLPREPLHHVIGLHRARRAGEPARHRVRHPPRLHARFAHLRRQNARRASCRRAEQRHRPPHGRGGEKRREPRGRDRLQPAHHGDAAARHLRARRRGPLREVRPQAARRRQRPRHRRHARNARHPNRRRPLRQLFLPAAGAAHGGRAAGRSRRAVHRERPARARPRVHGHRHRHYGEHGHREPARVHRREPRGQRLFGRVSQRRPCGGIRIRHRAGPAAHHAERGRARKRRLPTLRPKPELLHRGLSHVGNQRLRAGTGLRAEVDDGGGHCGRGHREPSPKHRGGPRALRRSR